jgi:ATP-binding cassette subfamily B protein
MLCLSNSYENRSNRATVGRVLHFFQPYRSRVTLTILAIIVVAVIGLANPYLLKLIIANAIPAKDMERLLLYVGLMIVLPIVTGLIGVGQTYLNTVIGQNVMRDLRAALYAHLQRMPLRFFTATRTGEIQARLSSDVSGVQQVVTDTATSIVSNLSGDGDLDDRRHVAHFLADNAHCTRLAPSLPLLDVSGRRNSARREDGDPGNHCRHDLSYGIRVNASLRHARPHPLTATRKRVPGPVRWARGNRRQPRRGKREAIKRIPYQVEETLSVSGMLLTKAFGRQNREIDRFTGLNSRLTDLQIKQQMVARWFLMIMGTFLAITPAFVYLYAGVHITGGNAR